MRGGRGKRLFPDFEHVGPEAAKEFGDAGIYVADVTEQSAVEAPGDRLPSDQFEIVTRLGHGFHAAVGLVPPPRGQQGEPHAGHGGQPLPAATVAGDHGGMADGQDLHE